MKRFMSEAAVGEIREVGWVKSSDNIADAPSRGLGCTNEKARQVPCYKVRWRVEKEEGGGK
jgi:hypothetical protein